MDFNVLSHGDKERTITASAGREDNYVIYFILPNEKWKYLQSLHKL